MIDLESEKKHDDFLKFNFSHFTPQVIIFFVEKRQPKILGLKNVMDKGVNKILTFVKL